MKGNIVNGINRFFAWVVSVNYYIYLVVGVVVCLTAHFLGWQKSTADHLDFLNYNGIPIIIYSLVQRLFCQIFYQEKYDKFSFRKVDHNIHIGIPKRDDTFYSVVTEKNLNSIRKFSGYLYAVSKPLTFINFGVVIVLLLFVMNGRV